MKHYEITPEQRSAFRAQGFLLLSAALPPELLAEWQRVLTELAERAQASYGSSSLPSNVGFLAGSEQALLSRANDLLGLYPDAVLDLLASPPLLAIARDLCGADAVPLQCDALFKHNHPESVVLWHQDAVHSRQFPYLNIGIYLDDADLGDGCLEYLAGSQHETRDVGNLLRTQGAELPNRLSVPAKAGDILIQNAMVWHSSGVKSSAGVRRTIYVEMRPAAAVLEQGAQSEAWTELRKRWMAMVLRRANAAWPQSSHAGLLTDLKSDGEEIAGILSLREAPLPANYFF